MGVFNFIETFFFISLGITFVLILLLVYHFKQRLNSIEQKSDTMFEIINNIVKEITAVKQFCMQPIRQNSFIPHLSPSTIQINLESIPEVEPHLEITSVRDEESDIDEDTDNEDTDDEDTDNEDTDDDESVSSSDSDISHVKHSNKIIVSDDELSVNSFPPKLPTRIDELLVDSTELLVDSAEAFVDSAESTKIITLNSDNLPLNPVIESSDIDLIDGIKIIKKTDQEIEYGMFKTITPPINDIQLSANPLMENTMDIYNKMSTTELKAMVIQKGLNTEPSKMKRPRLLQLLEKSV